MTLSALNLFAAFAAGWLVGVLTVALAALVMSRIERPHVCED